MDTFYLRPKILGELKKRSPAVSAEKAKKWREVFPDAKPAVLRAAIFLFPATEPRTFRSWLGVRSDIDAKLEAKEPLLREEAGRHTILPLKDPKMWEFRQKLQMLHWLAQEVDLSEDARDVKKVTKSEFELLKATLAWFGPADELVMAGLDDVAAEKLRSKEAQFYLRAQSNQECVHSEAYARQILEVIPLDEQPGVLAAAGENPLVARAADWIRWWVVAEHPAADFIAAMAFAEGVLFSGFFATLQYFKTRGVFPGVTALNEFIARDENVHTMFWCFLLNERLEHTRPSPKVVEQIARETVGLSEYFFTSVLREPLAGMNAGLMKEYVRFVADNVLRQIRREPIFFAKNPFAFMDALSLNEVAKSNFFEFRPTQYQKWGAPGALDFKVTTAPVALPADE